jgi:hypothetical protein
MKEKPFKLKTNVPPLFMAIIENDEQRRLTKSSPLVSFAEHKRLHIQHQDYIRAAEKATAGTKDKGKTSA